MQTPTPLQGNLCFRCAPCGFEYGPGRWPKDLAMSKRPSNRQQRLDGGAAKPKKRPSKSLEELKSAEDEWRSKTREIRYNLTDFTVEIIAKQFQNEIFVIPDYQREWVWSPKNKSDFIESLMLGLPIPFMFIAEEGENFEIVDGAQRIRTICSYISDEFPLGELTQLPHLKGFRFSQLPKIIQTRLVNKPLRIVVLEEGTSEEARQELFNRINTAGKRAKAAEVRRGAAKGPLMTMLQELAQDEKFRKLCPLSPLQLKHREDEELVLRFFAYSDEADQFRHDVDAFLTSYVKRHQHDHNLGERKQEFHRVLDFVDTHFPSHGFAKDPESNTTPRVRFEAIAVGANLALRENPNLVPRSMTWLDSEEFRQHTTTHASNSPQRLLGRIRYVQDALLRSAKEE